MMSVKNVYHEYLRYKYRQKCIALFILFWKITVMDIFGQQVRPHTGIFLKLFGILRDNLKQELSPSLKLCIKVTCCTLS